MSSRRADRLRSERVLTTSVYPTEPIVAISPRRGAGRRAVPPGAATAAGAGVAEAAVARARPGADGTPAAVRVRAQSLAALPAGGAEAAPGSAASAPVRVRASVGPARAGPAGAGAAGGGTPASARRVQARGRRPAAEKRAPAPGAAGSERSSAGVPVSRHEPPAPRVRPADGNPGPAAPVGPVLLAAVLLAAVRPPPRTGCAMQAVIRLHARWAGMRVREGHQVRAWHSEAPVLASGWLTALWVPPRRRRLPTGRAARKHPAASAGHARRTAAWIRAERSAAQPRVRAPLAVLSAAPHRPMASAAAERHVRRACAAPASRHAAQGRMAVASPRPGARRAVGRPRGPRAAPARFQVGRWRSVAAGPRAWAPARGWPGPVLPVACSRNRPERAADASAGRGAA